MRTIQATSQYKRDLKREIRGRYCATLATDLRLVLDALVDDQPLDAKYHDHALTGNKKNMRDCHIHPDLVLLYRKPDAETLHLLRLGSHSELEL